MTSNTARVELLATDRYGEKYRLSEGYADFVLGDDFTLESVGPVVLVIPRKPKKAEYRQLFLRVHLGAGRVGESEISPVQVVRSGDSIAAAVTISLKGGS